MADCSADYRLNLYIAVCHSNGRSLKNTISVVVNRLVGMGLKDYFMTVINYRGNADLY